MWLLENSVPTEQTVNKKHFSSSSSSPSSSISPTSYRRFYFASFLASLTFDFFVALNYQNYIFLLHRIS